MMSVRLISIAFAGTIALLTCLTASALPPLGLTQIDSDEDRFSRIAVFDGTAYVSTRSGVYPIDASGVQPLLLPAPIGFGPLALTTRVVKGESGELVFAASFEAGVTFDGVALSLDNLQTPLVTWNFSGAVRAIDSELGAVSGGRILLNDGSGFDTDASEYFFSGSDMTPSGVAIGFAAVPGTIGSVAALYDLDGDVEFLGPIGLQGGIKDRSDGLGINYGFSSDYHVVRYGESDPVEIDKSIDRSAFVDGFVHVSETDFVVVQAYNPNSPDYDFLAYYPGINPAGLDRSVPLGDLFPELSTIDFDRITDISSSEGQIHLLLSGDEGLWLFAARDPSVVPEPSAVCIGAMLVIGFAALRKQQG